MRRRVVALGALVVLVALAGCGSLLGPGEPDQEKLNEDANYTWDDDVDVSLTLEKDSFKGVYNVSNRSELPVYTRDGLGQEEHLEIRALKYRYPNGTVVSANSSALSASQTRDRTILDVPNQSGGRVAFTAPRQGKRFSTPVFVEGSTTLTLPPSGRVGVPLLSKVSPKADERTVTEDRMTLRWENVTSRVLSARYYLVRDLWLFGTILTGAVVVGSGGILYYWRQIKRLKRRREETGIDIDDDDDPRDDGPPPGMR